MNWELPNHSDRNFIEQAMTDKFQNKYNTHSHRMPGWDYAGNGFYFITLVTQNRQCTLGEIVNGEMILSETGQIVKNEWLQSFEIRDELILHQWAIMPNHIHAIVELIDIHVTPHGTHVRPDQSVGRVIAQRKPKSISSFMAGFKSAVTKKIDDYIDSENLGIPKYNRSHHFWQPNYHDHVIRDEQEYQRIDNYIVNNPKNWNDDKFRE